MLRTLTAWIAMFRPAGAVAGRTLVPATWDGTVRAMTGAP